MDDAQTIDLEEFRQLRSEINNRTTIGNQYVSYTVAALAAGIAVLDKLPDILLGLSVIIISFWLLWVDNTGQVFKIALYIAQKLATRLHIKKQGIIRLTYQHTGCRNDPHCERANHTG